MLQKIKATINKSPRWLRFCLEEGWPIVVILLATALELGHIATSGWSNIFIYNSDSLVLPLIRESLGHKEAFSWVFSSQFFLFPEGLFYFISSLLTTSIRSSLVFNAVLNMVALYTLIRFITRSVSSSPRLLQKVFSVSCCLILVFEMLLERQPLVNERSVATLFLLTTYYYGVILAGLVVLLIALLFLKRGKLLKARGLGLLIISCFVSALASFSDPLFLIQFVVPFVLAILVILLINSISLKKSYLLLIAPVLGTLIGYEARKPFKDFIGQSLNSHIVTGDIPQTLTMLHYSLSSALHSKSGKIEIVLCFGAILLALYYLIKFINKNSKTKNTYSSSLLLVTSFAVISPVVAVLFVIISGSMTSRYLLPIFIFPLVGLIPLLESKIIRFKRLVILFGAVVLLAVSVLGAISIPKAWGLLSTSNFSDSQCLEASLNNKAANGVGDYWTVRALDIYGQSNERVLQINNNLTLYPWLANLAAYKDKSFTFLVVSKPAPDNSFGAMLPSDTTSLGTPSHISSCQDLWIYSYQPPSTGYKMLNQDIQSSYRQLLHDRQIGTIDSNL